MVSAKAGSGVAVRAENVVFGYGEGAAMTFDLAVEPGALVAVMGPSGAGKSTLLNLIAGFETPRCGHILIAGEDVTRLAPAGRPVSMVFQENNLFAHLDVAANVGLGRSPSLKLDRADKQVVSAAISRVGLGGKERRLPRALSGGERRRVALARVLVRERPVLLLDEPFASLGPALGDEMVDLIAALQAERAMTVLLATHDPNHAERLCETIVFIENGQVAATGTTRDFFSASGPAAFLRYVGARYNYNTSAPSPDERR